MFKVSLKYDFFNDFHKEFRIRYIFITKYIKLSDILLLHALGDNLIRTLVDLQ